MMERIIIIGTCGSGKTTLGKQLSKKLGIPCTDMDELFWLPGWKKRSIDEFETLVKQATNPDRWIMCGNYSKLQHLTVSNADTIVWLDLPLYVLLWRLIKRSITQSIDNATICNGNRQSLSQFWWLFKHLFKSYWKKKQRYRLLQAKTPDKTWIKLTNSRMARDFLK